MNNLSARLAEIAAPAEDDIRWQKIEDLATDLFTEGTTLGQIKGFTATEIEAVYQIAHGFYQQRHYEKAAQLFQYFSMHEHTDRRFWMGWAASLQQLKRYQNAIRAYAVATMLDVGEADAPFHAAECYIALKAWDKAKESLEVVLTIAEDEEAHADYARRARNLLELTTNHRKGG